MSDGTLGAAAGAVVGGVIGFFAGGNVALGVAIGARLGRRLTAEPKQVEGPRLDDLKAKRSAYGESVQRPYGNARVPTLEIWRENNKLKEVAREEESDGKGGGGGVERTTYDYYFTGALLIGEGEIGGIRRAWTPDGTLIYDGSDNPNPDALTNGAAVIHDAGSTNRDLTSNLGEQTELGLIKVYHGGIDQQPDPTIQSDIGSDRTPAYRGWAYMVFEDFKVNKWGTFPGIEVETASAQSHDPRVVADLAPSLGTIFNQTQSAVYRDGAIDILSMDNSIYRVDQYDVQGNLVDKGREIEWNDTGAELQAVCINNPRYAGAYKLKAFGKSWVAWVVDGQLKDEESEFFRTDPSHPDYRGFAPNLNRTFVEAGGSLFAEVSFPNDSDYYLGKFAGADTNLLNWARIGDSTIGGRDKTVDENGFIWIRDGTKFYKVSQEPKLVDVIDLGLDTDGVGDNFMIWQGLLYARESSDDAKLYTFPGGKQISSGISGLSSILPLQGGPLGLADGQSIVTIQPQQTADGITIGSIVSDLAQRAGLNASDIDTSDLTKTIPGYVVTRPTSAAEAIGGIRPLGQFDAAEIDYQLRFIPRGGSPVKTLDQGELAAHELGQDRPAIVEEEITQQTDLPRRLHVEYSDVDRDYERSSQYAGRQTVRNEDEQRIEIAASLTANTAAQTADTLLRERWASRNTLNVVTSWRHLDLTPADVITVIDADGGTRTGRITSIDDGRPGLLKMELLPDGPNVYQSSAEGESNQKASAGPVVGGPTNLVLLDLPPVRDQDSDPGYYVAMGGVLGGWRGATLFESTDGGDTYDPLLTSTTRAGVGRTTETLPPGPTAVWDRGNSLNIRMSVGELQSRTDMAVLNGQGALAIQAGNDWEIVQYADRTLENDGTETISRLIRGRKGTEHLVDQHAPGDQVVVLRQSDDSILRAQEDADALGMIKRYKPVTIGSQLSRAPSETFTPRGRALRPFSPSHLTATEGADINASWIRRNRIVGEWRDRVDVPMSEDTEEYQIEFRDSGGNVLRTKTVTSESVTYTASEQDSDGVSRGDIITIAVAQVSATVGAGIESTTTVEAQ